MEELTWHHPAMGEVRGPKQGRREATGFTSQVPRRPLMFPLPHTVHSQSQEAKGVPF